MDKLHFSKIRDVKSPSRAHPTDAGLDMYIPNDWNSGEKFIIHPQEHVLIPSGIKVRVPSGWALIAFNKSGVATRKHLDVMACVVDVGYEGEIGLSILNAGSCTQYLTPGEKIIQFVMLPIGSHEPTEVPLEELYDEKSSRGEGGFGSSGNK